MTSINEALKSGFLSTLTAYELDQKIKDEAYLGILANENTLANHLMNVPMHAHDKFSEYLCYIMSRPEYFYFIIKVLFGMETFPMQALILKELFEHRFPILIGARGLSKCVLSSLVVTTYGIKNIKNMGIKNIPHVRQDIGDIDFYGEKRYSKVDYGFFNGYTDTKKITTRSGRVLEGTLNHPIRVVSNGEIVWKEMSDIKVSDYAVIQRKYEQWEKPNDLGPNVAYTLGTNTDKSIPDIVFGAKFESISAYLSGLFDTYSIYNTEDSTIELSTDSFEFIEEIQFLLLILGINSNVKNYKLCISGSSLKTFMGKVGSRIKENQLLLEKYCVNITVENSNFFEDEIVSIEDSSGPTYDVHLKGDDHSFVSNGFISHNSFTLGMYLLIRMIITPGVKCVITGAGFRQAKMVFEVMEGIWNKAPMLRNCFKGSRNGPFHQPDAWYFRLGDSICHALPVGHDGQKIRGYRAQILVCDEFSSVNPIIFEEVMSGFLSVKSDSIQQLKNEAYHSTMKLIGTKSLDEYVDSYTVQNQLILSGTPYYKHNHFYKYFTKWRDIIYSKGDPKKLSEILPEAEKDDSFNWKDYAIMRIPVNLIQSGHMDMAQVNRIRASVTNDIFMREFMSVFSNDSDGFFKRSLIDFCTVSENNSIVKNGELVKFAPTLYGNPKKKYIFGVDPAYQGDNFAIVILEMNDGYRAVVHCWTIQASDHKQMLKDCKENNWGIDIENQYYDYCARKIRNLMKRFPCAYIALDPMGGGKVIMESLADPAKLKDGEELILPIIDSENKPKEEDFIQGQHIIHTFKNTSDNIGQANHALKKDMESRDIIFPFHDSLSYAGAEFYDISMGEASVLYDTLEDCITDIEELKNELSTIVITETASMREHFDTPSTKSPGQAKGRLRKDRYSALLMANWVARSAENLVVRHTNSADLTNQAYFGRENPDSIYLGNNKIAQKLNELYR